MQSRLQLRSARGPRGPVRRVPRRRRGRSVCRLYADLSGFSFLRFLKFPLLLARSSISELRSNPAGRNSHHNCFNCADFFLRHSLIPGNAKIVLHSWIAPRSHCYCQFEHDRLFRSENLSGICNFTKMLKSIVRLLRQHLLLQSAGLRQLFQKEGFPPRDPHIHLGPSSAAASSTAASNIAAISIIFVRKISFLFFMGGHLSCPFQYSIQFSRRRHRLRPRPPSRRTGAPRGPQTT